MREVLVTLCPACGGALRRWRPDVAVCRHCGTSSRLHRPDRRELQAIYADYYADVPPLSPLSAARLRLWADWLGRHRQLGRSLEIGSGAGHFLAAMQSAGFEAWGTEISESAVDMLRRRGLNVLEGALPDLQLPDGHFDAVVLLEVLEHLDDPLSYLAEARRVLRDGGVVLLTTPNFDSLSRRLLADRWRSVDLEHLVLFTGRGLQQALRRAGFSVRSLDSRNVDPLEILRVMRARARCGTEERQRRVDTCRGAIASRPWLRTARDAVNVGLRVLGLGDTLEARAQR